MSGKMTAARSTAARFPAAPGLPAVWPRPRAVRHSQGTYKEAGPRQAAPYCRDSSPAYRCRSNPAAAALETSGTVQLGAKSFRTNSICFSNAGDSGTRCRRKLPGAGGAEGLCRMFCCAIAATAVSARSASQRAMSRPIAEIATTHGIHFRTVTHRFPPPRNSMTNRC